VKSIFGVCVNFARLLGQVQSTSRAIWTARPRTLDVEHVLDTAVPTEIADDV
jgi:hypothetical protein